MKFPAVKFEYFVLFVICPILLIIYNKNQSHEETTHGPLPVESESPSDKTDELRKALQEENWDRIMELSKDETDFHTNISIKKDNDTYHEITPLFLAVINGRVDELKQLIKSGATVNDTIRVTNERKQSRIENITPLMIAISKGDISCTMALIEAKADIHTSARVEFNNGIFIEKLTPLMMAIESKKILCLNALIDAGADVNAGTEMRSSEGISLDNQTPLMTAVIEGDTGILKALIEAGAKVDITTQIKANDGSIIENWTPLMEAAQLGNDACIDLLLHSGAKVYEIRKKNATGQIYSTSILDLARQAKHQSSVDLLQKAYNDALSNALNKVDLEEAMNLIRQGADIDTKVTVRISPSEVRELTALYVAILLNKESTAQELIKSGAQVNTHMIVQNFSGASYSNWTPLMEAVAQNNPSCLQALIKAGADINAHTVVKLTDGTMNGNWSPLAESIARGHTACLVTLINAGAELHKRILSKNPQGKTEYVSILNLATRLKREDCVTLLNQALDIRLQHAIKNNDLSLSLALVQVGANVNMKIILRSDKVEFNPMTPLIMALNKNNTEAVKFLIDSGADVNMATRIQWRNGTYAENMTPLLMATSIGNANAVNMLLKAGAKTNTLCAHTDIRGKRYIYSCLDIASAKNYSACSKLLIKYGARKYASSRR